MAAHPLSLEVKFLLMTAINAVTAGGAMALKKIPDEDSDLRDGLTKLMACAQEVLQDVVSRAHEK